MNCGAHGRARSPTIRHCCYGAGSSHRRLRPLGERLRVLDKWFALEHRRGRRATAIYRDHMVDADLLRAGEHTCGTAQVFAQFATLTY